ncbi:MAG: substrate-binding domain-containing protein [Clostridium sp.]|nr:substrate-binding domain-containing protein [Clostridium sp.]
MSHTAVFAVSDYYAAELIQFLQERGIQTPEDISVAGFDDCPISRRIYPKLTTIRQNGKERAELAVAMLKELKEGKGEGETYTLPVELVKRQSVSRLHKDRGVFL